MPRQSAEVTDRADLGQADRSRRAAGRAMRRARTRPQHRRGGSDHASATSPWPASREAARWSTGANAYRPCVLRTYRRAHVRTHTTCTAAAASSPFWRCRAGAGQGRHSAVPSMAPGTTRADPLERFVGPKPGDDLRVQLVQQAIPLADVVDQLALPPERTYDREVQSSVQSRQRGEATLVHPVV
jgi:hypothetical protein